MKDLTQRILEFIQKKGAVFYSDIAREFNVSIYTARDLVNVLAKEGKVSVNDKGIAKLVISKSERKPS